MKGARVVDGSPMEGQKKNRATGPDVVGEARGASRWFTALAVYDVLAVAVLALLAIAGTMQGAVIVAIAAVALASIFALQAYWKLAAGWKIRAGITAKGGDVFAAGFGHLRKLLIWTFFGNVVLLMQQVSCYTEPF